LPAVSNVTPRRHSTIVDSASSCFWSASVGAKAAFAAPVSAARWRSLSALSAFGLANSTIGRGHSATFAVRWLATLS
jgi:hypothetical protein